MRAYAISDLQFGSTGKGLLAGYLARRRRPDGVVCAFGPNAGHTFIDGAGRKFVHIMMPMGVFSPNIKHVLIGPGAVIHPNTLLDEYIALKELGYQFKLAIHESAAVVAQRHRDEEGGLGAIGSTQKGTGAAAAERIRRSSPLGAIIARDALRRTPLEGYLVGTGEYDDIMDSIELLQVEGAQGFSLGIDAGFYPYCTYRPCHTWQLLSDCGVPVRGRSKLHLESYGVARTYPIRVNNKTGSSGPCYHDQEEITWEAIGQAPELTTVTKLQRRVFTFSMEQIRQAVRMNGTDAIFLNFCNYNEVIAHEIAARIERELKVPVLWKGYGPSETDVVEEVK